GARAEAQQPAKIPRIGFVAANRPDTPSIVEFRRGLRDLGYIEGKNILIEYRSVEGVAEFPNVVAEVVRLKVDVIVVPNTPGAQAAKNATTTIPVIFINAGDPVGTGIVASLARPGGNVTGLSNLSPELSGKQLELLKEAFPKISHVAVLSETANTGNAASLGEMKVAAEALRVTLQRLEVRGPDDFESAFSAIKKERGSAPYSTEEQRHQGALGTDRGPCDQERVAGAVSRQLLHRRRWSHVLWPEAFRAAPARRHLRGQDPERGQAGGSPCGATN